MPALRFDDHLPVIDPSAFVAPDAWAIGEVSVGKDCCILFGVVLRGDILPIIIGDGSNAQEHSVFHTTTGQTPTIVGKNVTVGHSAILHGCTVQDSCIIGMHSTILDGAVIPSNCIVGANSLVPLNFKGEEGTLIVGSPAKVKRTLRPEEIEQIQESARHYQEKGRAYKVLLPSA